MPSSQYRDHVRIRVAAAGFDPDAVKADHVEDARYSGKSVDESAAKEIRRQKRLIERQQKYN